MSWCFHFGSLLLCTTQWARMACVVYRVAAGCSVRFLHFACRVQSSEIQADCRCVSYGGTFIQRLILGQIIVAYFFFCDIFWLIGCIHFIFTAQLQFGWSLVSAPHAIPISEDMQRLGMPMTIFELVIWKISSTSDNRVLSHAYIIQIKNSIHLDQKRRITTRERWHLGRGKDPIFLIKKH